MIGLIIVAQISAALFSFSEVPEHQRPGFSLYVDEFQIFGRTPDFARLFSQGRKFGIRLTLCHQYRDQLPGTLQEATETAQIKVCFNLKADDAKEMAQYFPPSDDGRIAEVEAHATAALLTNPGSDDQVRRFTDLYLRPLQSQRKGGKVRIEQQGLSLGTVLWLGYEEARKAAKENKAPEVEDPTQYLDDLLRDVMHTHNPHLSIPPKAVIGFADSGHGFYGAVKHLQPCAELTYGYQFPPQVVAGDHWLRAPKNDYERFLDFVFTLRQVMRYLAAHPLGKKAEATHAAVAQLLTQLPHRHALVRSGDHVGRIYTYDTPPHVEGAELAERVAFIRERTRAKYCRPRAAIEQAFSTEPVDLPESVDVHLQRQPISRWAEIAGWAEINEP